MDINKILGRIEREDVEAMAKKKGMSVEEFLAESQRFYIKQKTDALQKLNKEPRKRFRDL